MSHWSRYLESLCKYFLHGREVHALQHAVFVRQKKLWTVIRFHLAAHIHVRVSREAFPVEDAHVSLYLLVTYVHHVVEEKDNVQLVVVLNILEPAALLHRLLVIQNIRPHEHQCFHSEHRREEAD